MRRHWLRGATAAATLPAALAAGVLVSAPFAGTTTQPLADTVGGGHLHSTHALARSSAPRHADAVPARPASSPAGSGLSASPGSLTGLAAAEMALLGVGGAVIVTAYRRRPARR